MLAIYKRELRTYFNSWLGWIYLGLNFFFTGWYFRSYGMVNGYPYISYIISGILFLFLFTLPILSMRCFAEEKRQKTDLLLFTAPVSIWKIILGKYFAMVTMFGLIVAMLGIYPLIMRIYGNVPMGENYLALLGFLLFGMTCLAVGVLISALAENQIIAAVVTFFVLLLGVMIPGICDLISPSGNLLTRFLSVFDLTAYMNYCLYGQLYIPCFFYYFSVIFLCLYLTGFFLTKKRWKIATHGVGKAVSNFSGAIVLVAAVIVANYGIGLIPLEYTLKDLTYNSIYSITKESRAVLDELDKDVTLYVWGEESKLDSTIQTTLEKMAEYSPHIKISVISPSEQPYFYVDYTETCPADNSIIVATDTNHYVVEYMDCYQLEYQYDFNYSTGAYEIKDYTVKGYDGEGQIISAIQYVVKDFSPKIYCITGHDELELEDTLQTLLKKAHYSFETINLLTYDAIPSDAACIFTMGPLEDYSREEVDKINAYMENGGNAVFVVAFTDAQELTNYYSLLSPYGITVFPGLVMEAGTSFYNGYQYLLLPDIVNTDITEGIYSSMRNKYIYMPYAKGMKINETAGVSYNVFLQTTENAFAMESLSGNSERGPEDEPGPFALGIYAEKVDSNASSRVVVFASDYYFYNDVDTVVNGNNYTLFMNALSKMMGNETIRIIPAKSYSYDAIVMSEASKTFFSVLVIGIIPLVLVMMGFNVWYFRRKH